LENAVNKTDRPLSGLSSKTIALEKGFGFDNSGLDDMANLPYRRQRWEE